MIGGSDGKQYESDLDFIMGKAAEFNEKNKAKPAKPNTENEIYFGNQNPAEEEAPAVGLITAPLKSMADLGYRIKDIFDGRIKPGTEEYGRTIAEIGINMIGLPAPVASKMVDGSLGSFMGVRSKTLDHRKLQMAQKMESDGLPSNVIWEQTGTFKGADGRWRQEISDKNAKLKTDGIQVEEYTPALPDKPSSWTNVDTRSGDAVRTTTFLKPVYWMEDVIDHPELFKAYPQLKEFRVAPMSEEYAKSTNAMGAFDREQKVLWVRQGLDPDYLRSVLLHEGQHGVQGIEGFARGGNPQMFNLPPKEAEAMYMRLKGEVEAYNVNKRQNMSDAERRVTPPQNTEAVPRELQIDPPM